MGSTCPLVAECSRELHVSNALIKHKKIMSGWDIDAHLHGAQHVVVNASFLEA